MFMLFESRDSRVSQHDYQNNNKKQPSEEMAIHPTEAISKFSVFQLISRKY